MPDDSPATRVGSSCSDGEDGRSVSIPCRSLPSSSGHVGVCVGAQGGLPFRGRIAGIERVDELARVGIASIGSLGHGAHDDRLEIGGDRCAEPRRRQLADPGLTRERLVALMEECVATDAKGWGTGAYGVSKAALNALTRILARELVPRRIRVNATTPGWVRTDMGGRGAPRSVEEGAASVLFAVTLPEGGPTGKVFRDGRETAP